MNGEVYPQNIDELINKMNNDLKNNQNIDQTKQIIEWLKWYSSLELNKEFQCSNNDFLKAHSKNGNFALQLWEHDVLVDHIKYNIVANFPSEYSNEETIFTNE